jgi:hypothetical protein
MASICTSGELTITIQHVSTYRLWHLRDASTQLNRRALTSQVTAHTHVGTDGGRNGNRKVGHREQVRPHVGGQSQHERGGIDYLYVAPLGVGAGVDELRGEFGDSGRDPVVLGCNQGPQKVPHALVLPVPCDEKLLVFP